MICPGPGGRGLAPANGSRRDSRHSHNRNKIGSSPPGGTCDSKTALKDKSPLWDFIQLKPQVTLLLTIEEFQKRAAHSTAECGRLFWAPDSQCFASGRNETGIELRNKLTSSLFSSDSYLPDSVPIKIQQTMSFH